MIAAVVVVGHKGLDLGFQIVRQIIGCEAMRSRKGVRGGVTGG
jgi:hypothetical protein